MAIIDQRILIPARQELVWAFVSDLTRNAEWQVDCQAVSFLSTKHTGQGTRWRSTTDRGKDTVLEITSWYNGLGYEYVYVDGVSYKENKGRLRLQEIPEGTVVQWTFTFETGGLFGGRGSRHVDATMAASLKALYKAIKSFNQSSSLEAKSLIREAPDVEARAAYKPRHPSAVTDAVNAGGDEEAAVLLPVANEPARAKGDATLVTAIDLTSEPPVRVDDTKPRPAVSEPEGDERFARKQELTEPLETVSMTAEPEPTKAESTPAPDKAKEPATPESEPEPEHSAWPPAEPQALPRAERTAAVLSEAAAAVTLPPADTSGKSIWEVFGVKPPSGPAEVESSVVEAAPEAPTSTAESAAPAPAEPERASPPTPHPLAVTIPAVVVQPSGILIPAAAPGAHMPRRGLRVVERRALVRLRRPN